MVYRELLCDPPTPPGRTYSSALYRSQVCMRAFPHRNDCHLGMVEKWNFFLFFFLRRIAISASFVVYFRCPLRVVHPSFFSVCPRGRWKNGFARLRLKRGPVMFTNGLTDS
ncbi:hypothetical protein AVEN_199562-1 [Araneus ventricosus]|uniref:Uncharacterized protein n=1 Tax=Araneus ventricosus TaxID=182803 RepID=A0A4Y2KU34_ARAVE|nr:hypothetical protein AVEN_199562-1 [Araneus ventricosus]